MKCKNCGKQHANSKCDYILMDKIKDKGFPTHSRSYKTAHTEANREEKRAFGAKQYKQLDKLDRKLPKHELAGKNTKSGKIEVSKKLPAKYDKEISFHEMVENYKLRHKKK